MTNHKLIASTTITSGEEENFRRMNCCPFVNNQKEHGYLSNGISVLKTHNSAVQHGIQRKNSSLVPSDNMVLNKQNTHMAFKGRL